MCPSKLMMNKKALIAAIVLATAVLLTARAWMTTSTTSDVQHAALTTTTASSTAAQTMPSHSPLSPSLQHSLQSTSLAQTQPPAQFQFDSDGRLIVDAATKDILDYFLALVGELPDEQIRTLVAQWANTSGDLTLTPQVLVLYDRYREWLHAFARGDFSAQDFQDVRSKIATRRQIRDDILGTEWSGALYQLDDQYDEFSLRRAELLRADLSTEDKQQALRALEAELPEQLARAYQQERALQQLDQTEQQLRTDGADDDAIYQSRQQQFGDAAAARMAELDQQRAQWQQRYDAYVQKQNLIQHSGLAPSDQQQQIEALREQMFDPSEALRAEALDRLRLSSP